MKFFFEMKVIHLSTILQNVKDQLGFRNVFSFSSYSITTPTKATWNLRKIVGRGSMYDLYRRITPLGDPTVSIAPLLDQWVEEGRPVDKEQLKVMIKDLRYFKRFTHALEISMWMTDKRYFELTAADTAVRLDLIAKVKGLEQAEIYFSNVPRKLITLEVYSALLNCYSYAKSVKKAEVVMQKMRDLGLARTTLEYNCMLNLYYQTGNYEKLDSLMLEMKEKNISYDKYTFGIRLSAYAAASDSEGIDNTLKMMESYPNVALNWIIYVAAATGYAKSGLLDKALAMLKKSEGLMSGKNVTKAYPFLLTQYTKYGKKDEVLRIWELYKENVKVNNKGYICIIPSLLKFDDLETAEMILEEWESRNLHYDFRIPNFLIGVYCKKGLLEKAEALITKGKLKGGKPHVKTWYYMAEGYLRNNQTQKAVEAMKKSLLIYRTPTKWKPNAESLVGCLDYFEDEGDMEGAENFIELLGDKEIISADLQDRLLNNLQDGKSNSDAFRDLYNDSLLGAEETLSESEDDSSALIQEN